MRKREPFDDGIRVEFTPMIDVVFLLLIFFMLIPIKEMEAKLETKVLGESKGKPVQPLEEKVVFYIDLESISQDEEVITQVSVNSRSVAKMRSPSPLMIGAYEEQGGKVWRRFIKEQKKLDEEQADPSSPSLLAVSKALQGAIVGAPEGTKTKVVIRSKPGVPFKWVMAVFNTGLSAGLENMQFEAPGEEIWKPEVF